MKDECRPLQCKESVFRGHVFCVGKFIHHKSVCVCIDTACPKRGVFWGRWRVSVSSSIEAKCFYCSVSVKLQSFCGYGYGYRYTCRYGLTDTQAHTLTRERLQTFFPDALLEICQHLACARIHPIFRPHTHLILDWNSSSHHIDCSKYTNICCVIFSSSSFS